MSENAVAAVLALVGSQEAEAIEADLPAPPVSTSPKGTAIWYALLGAYEFSLGEMLLLEQLVNTQTHLDELEDSWTRDNRPALSKGSTGQDITDPRVQEMRLLRAQVQSLVKALALPAEDGQQQKRRPGRPSRSSGGGSWGAR